MAQITAAGQLFGNNQVSGVTTAQTSGGTTWQAVYNSASTRIELWFSDDDGSTWTERTGLRITSVSNSPTFSITTDQKDRLWLALGQTSGTTKISIFGTAIDVDSQNSWTTNDVNFQDSSYVKDLEIIAYTRNTTNLYVGLSERITVHVLATLQSSTELFMFSREYNSNGTVRVSTSFLEYNLKIRSGNLSGSRHSYGFSVDYKHTSSGEVADDESPPIWVVYERSTSASSTSYEIIAIRLTRLASEYQIGTRRVITSETGVTGTSPLMSGVFDGSRFVMALVKKGSPGIIHWYERDAADTTTTERVVPTLSGAGNITGLKLTVSSLGGITMNAVGSTLNDVYRTRFNRNSGTFTAWEIAHVTTASRLSAARLTTKNKFQVVWNNNLTVTSGTDSYLVAPLAPTWVSPANNSYSDTALPLTLVWSMNDTNAGDTQSAYALSRQIDDGALEYFSVASGTWGATETKNTSSTQSVTLSTAQDGLTPGLDNMVLFKVRTWDSSDLVGPYGSGLMIIGSESVTPVLTSPEDGSTISTNKVTVAWTTTEQRSYRVRLLTSSNVVLYDSNKVTSSTVREIEPPNILPDGLINAKAEVRVWNDQDLQGPTDTHTFSVEYVEPATPSISVVVQPSYARIAITPTDPAPTGEQPTVVSHDLYVRVSEGGLQDMERPVGGDGIRIVAENDEEVMYDLYPTSGVDYQYRVKSNANNGTSSWSAWT
jgi:hypothetical protein